MEGKEEGQYQVVITKPAEINFYEILDYLYDQYSIDRAEEIANGLRDKAKELKHQPERGAIEPRLSHRPKDYRFILYKRTPRAYIKILYYIDYSEKRVNITDFFPTEMDDNKIIKRNE